MVLHLTLQLVEQKKRSVLQLAPQSEIALFSEEAVTPTDGHHRLHCFSCPHMLCFPSSPLLPLDFLVFIHLSCPLSSYASICYRSCPMRQGCFLQDALSNLFSVGYKSEVTNWMHWPPPWSVTHRHRCLIRWHDFESC